MLVTEYLAPSRQVIKERIDERFEGIEAQADAQTLHRQINEANKRHGFFKGAISLNDIRICVAAAVKLEHEIEL